MLICEYDQEVGYQAKWEDGIDIGKEEEHSFYLSYI